MKLFVVFSVLAFCACANATFFKNHPLLGGQKSSTSIDTAPVETPSSGGAGLASLGKLLLIPLNLKKTLLQSHQKRINKHFDHVIKTLNSFGGSLGGGSTNEVSTISETGTSFGTDVGTTYTAPDSGPSFGSESGPTFVSESGPSFTSGNDNLASAGGLSGSFGGGSSVDYNALGGGSEISSGSTTYQGGYSGGSAYQGGSSYSAGSASGNVGASLGAPGSVHTYHPQPAPNTQYSNNPVVLHLYAVDNGAQTHASSDCNTAPIPQPIAPAPIISAPQQTYDPAPQQSYEPVDFETPVSSSFSNVEVQAQTMEEVKPTNTYLPPFRRY